MAFKQNPEDFFRENGVDVITAVVDGQNVRGILANEFDDVLDVESSNPRFHTAVSLLPAGVVKDSVVVAKGTTYHVTELHPDGTGVTVLFLEDQTP